MKCCSGSVMDTVKITSHMEKTLVFGRYLAHLNRGLTHDLRRRSKINAR
jgi:hypothetical protein